MQAILVFPKNLYFKIHTSKNYLFERVTKEVETKGLRFPIHWLIPLTASLAIVGPDWNQEPGVVSVPLFHQPSCTAFVTSFAQCWVGGEAARTWIVTHTGCQCHWQWLFRAPKRYTQSSVCLAGHYYKGRGDSEDNFCGLLSSFLLFSLKD